MIRVKAKAVREIKSPFDAANPDQQLDGTTPKVFTRDPAVCISLLKVYVMFVQVFFKINFDSCLIFVIR